MCWSGEASAVLATIGLSTTAYAAYKKEPDALWAALGYFALMEALQAYTYSVIDQCGAPANQIATILGYLHITFQPFFVNAVSLYFVPKEVARKIEKPIYFLCFVSAIYMLLQLYPFEWAGACQAGRMLCSTHLCSVSGNWHIAWDIPVNSIGNWFFAHYLTGYPSYTLVAFILPIFYGSWRMTLYHFTMGPMLARLSTSNLNEVPAVWCLLSIGLLLIVVKSPLRKLLFVRSWPLWKLLGYKYEQRAEPRT